jgi:hypothetical protein
LIFTGAITEPAPVFWHFLARERDTPRLANHHREIPATSSVITLDDLPGPRFRRVSKPNRCDDRGFSWVEEVGESESQVQLHPGDRRRQTRAESVPRPYFLSFALPGDAELQLGIHCADTFPTTLK